MTAIDVDVQSYEAAAARLSRRVIVCAGTGCVANGALAVHAALAQEMTAAGLDVKLKLDAHEDTDAARAIRLSESGCQGFCQMGPLVTILPERILYTRVRPADVPDIVNETLKAGRLVERLLYRRPRDNAACRGPDDIPFYARQTRLVLGACGRIDPDDLNEYRANGGYRGARRAFRDLSAEEVCRLVSEAGLRGRGGGGFPTGRK